jgi:hypothetical protein
MSPDTLDIEDGPPMPHIDHPSRLISHPIRFGEYIAHMSAYAAVIVTASCDPKQGKARENVIEKPNFFQ